MVTRLTRISNSLEEEIKKVQLNVERQTGIKISFPQASDLFLKKINNRKLNIDFRPERLKL